MPYSGLGFVGALLCLSGATAQVLEPPVTTSTPTPRLTDARPALTDPAIPTRAPDARSGKAPARTLIALGDSLTHGTMDATNNGLNTLHAYLQQVADSLSQVMRLRFTQPLFNEQGERVSPLEVPTNLGVDGADTFSLEGLEYYKRAGADTSFLNEDYFCDAWLPRRLESKSDKVMYPINVRSRQDVTQIDAAIWLINHFAPPGAAAKAFVVLWAGNNDSSTAALGSGGDNPMFVPVPLDQIEPEISRDLRLLLRLGERLGLVSFDAYTPAAIERNLTGVADFADQYNHLLDRLESETGNALAGGRIDLMLLTLPYYSSVAYLMDSEDLEFYFRKVNPAYTVPPSFARVALPGEPIADPLQGDRISLLTFGLMYMLLDIGYSVDYVNQVLEMDGTQRDDMVLSNAEQQYIISRIDSFNDVIKAAASARGPHAHLIDVGKYLNDVLTGRTPTELEGRTVSRKWIRGSAFTLDGVHPGYTGQAFIANYVLQQLNAQLGLTAPMVDLSNVFATDPYIDRDGDGWAPGPEYETSGLAEVLFLLTDSDDTDPAVGLQLPTDIWQQVSDALLGEVLGIPRLRAEAVGLGIVPSE